MECGLFVQGIGSRRVSLHPDPFLLVGPGWFIKTLRVPVGGDAVRVTVIPCEGIGVRVGIDTCAWIAAEPIKSVRIVLSTIGRIAGRWIVARVERIAAIEIVRGISSGEELRKA
jgi:hypothetical protein